MSGNLVTDPGRATELAEAEQPPSESFGVTPSQRHLSAGQLLFREGAASAGVYRLQTGRVRLFRSTPTGIQVAMHTVRRGELFAEASLFSARYHCDAVALEPSEVLVYPKRPLVQSLREHPERLWIFTAELARRVQGLRSRAEIKQIRSASERVLQFLALVCDASGVWRQEGTLKQLADDIGLTHEALYRTLARLEHEGRIVRLEGALRLRRQLP